jgi:hypothetical protein
MSQLINGFFTGDLQPSTTVAGCIEIFENAWPNPNETVSMVEQRTSDPTRDTRWEKATTFGDGQFQSIRTNKHLSVTHYAKLYDDSVFQNIHNQFYTLLLATSLGYSRRNGIDEQLWHEDYNLLKYSDNQAYGQHYDGMTSTGRCVSALCYLNNDYEGGELEFPHFNLTIKPQPGMLILFPSNFAYAHVAHPIISGTKYALVTWMRDRNNFNE